MSEPTSRPPRTLAEAGLGLVHEEIGAEVYLTLGAAPQPPLPDVTCWIPFGETIEHVAVWDAPTGGNQVPVKLIKPFTITIDITGAEQAIRAMRLLFGPTLVRKADRIRRRRERLERTEQRQMHQDYRRRQIARRRRRRQQ